LLLPLNAIRGNGMKSLTPDPEAFGIKLTGNGNGNGYGYGDGW